MELRVERWARSEPPDERTLLDLFDREGLSPFRWWNEPGDVYPEHRHAYDKVIYVARGAITWVLPELGRELETRAGDRIELPRGTLHAAKVGGEGVTCLEAHLD